MKAMAHLAIWLALAAVWWLFAGWYEGSRTPLTAAEIERLISRIEQRAGANSHSPFNQIEDLRRFAESDDGQEFYMVNLIKFREEPPLYPEGFPGKAATVAEADDFYTSNVVLNHLLPNAGHPVAGGNMPLTIIAPAGQDMQWDQVALVRYRSRRDMLEMGANPEFAALSPHKWASVETTYVAASEPFFVLASPRILVPLFLIVAGLLASAGVALRRAAHSQARGLAPARAAAQ